MVEPGITIGTGEGGNAFGDRFIIRGFEARNDVFVDGLRDPGVIVRETFAVEQIEISKGPSSTFAGRGTTGGAVNSVSKMPMEESFSKLTAGLGTDSFQRYTIDTNQTVSDMVTLRVNALYHDADVAGRDHVAENREGATIASLFRLTDDLRLTLDYYHLKTDDIPDGGIPWNTADGAPYDVDRSNFYGQLNRDFWETKADISTVKLEYDFTDRLRLSSQTRYGKTGNTYVITVPSPVNTDPTLINANAQSRDQTNEYIGHQTNLIMDLAQGDVGHTVVVGIEVTKEEVENNPFTVTPVVCR